MKLYKSIILFAIIALLSSCGRGNTNTSSTPASRNVEINVDSIKTKVADEIKSWGAIDAYFDDDNYFVYCVNPSEISASPDEVAKAMYPMVTEVPNVKGCIVMNAQTKKEIGRYEVK